MKKYYIIIISLFFLFGCKNNNNIEKKNSEIIIDEKYTEIIDNKLIYELINQVLSENKLYKHCGAIMDRKTFIIRNGDELLLEEIDSIFQENDKKFILKQFRNGNRFVLNQKFIKSKKIIELDSTVNSKEQRDKYWKKINLENKCIGYFYVPLFNLKKNTAIIECGINDESGIFIYKLNKENKWELSRTLQRLIE